MSQTVVSDEIRESNHAQCNGDLVSSPSLKENAKLAQDKLKSVNGIYLPENELKTQTGNEADLSATSREEGEKSTGEEKGVHDDQTEKTTDKLIDEFSTALALSVVHSSTNEPKDINTRECDPSDDPASKNTDKDFVQEAINKQEPINLNAEAADSVVGESDSKEADSEYVVAVKNGITYMRYESERQMPAIMQLITKDLSEPYSIYTYRYFIHNWPQLCFLAIHESSYVGAIVCKLDMHKKISRRGYIAMLAVDKSVRRRSIGTNLVKMAIETMNKEGCDEVVLETEVTNKPALNLYENLGFVRDKRLFRYYLNGVDALRLKLWLQ